MRQTPCDSRQWRAIRAIEAQVREHCQAYVREREQYDAAQSDVCDSRVDGEKKVDEAREEKEDRHVQERDDCLDSSAQFKSFYAIEDIRSHSSTLVRCTAAQRKSQISSGPLLHQCRGKRAGQAEDQTEDPHHVDPNGRRCWLEWRGHKAREWGPVGIVHKLLRYLSKERIGRIAGIGR